jgi:AraC-like DNA-binding protein
MDRHDVSEMVTAEIVARLHQQDLKIQDQFQCRGLTYWFDGKRKTAFCLIEAPDKKKIQKMHHFAHGEVPNEVIEVDPKIVESFLGRIEDPENTDHTLRIINEPAFRTVMVIRSFFENQKGNRQFNSSLNQYSNKIGRLLKIYEGAIVKRTANYYLVSFQSSSKAVQAALKIRSLLKSATDLGCSLKIGLSAGAPVIQKKLFFEEAIRLAERMSTAVKGEVIISAEVQELYNNENPTPLRGVDFLLSLSKNDEDFLTLLMDSIESAWDNIHLKVDALAKPLGCSKSQLYRKMIAVTGKSPNTFIKEYRLSKALELLLKKNRNISEIAYETGFTSPSYFSKCFQKKYGCLPSACFSSGDDTAV